MRDPVSTMREIKKVKRGNRRKLFHTEIIMEEHSDKGMFKQRPVKRTAMSKAKGRWSRPDRRHSKYKGAEVATSLACSWNWKYTGIIGVQEQISLKIIKHIQNACSNFFYVLHRQNKPKVFKKTKNNKKQLDI